MALKRVYSIWAPAEPRSPREDLYINKYPFFNVLDGASEPHSIVKPSISFSEMTGGRMVVEEAASIFKIASPDSELEDNIFWANREIEKKIKQKELPLNNAGLIPLASFVFTKIARETVKIIQGGDCLAAWSYSSGEIGFTINKAYAHVVLNLKTIDKIIERNGGDRKEMWVEFCPILIMRRQRDINNPESKFGYAALNGQSDIIRCWQIREIPMEGLKTLILFSDGFVPYYKTSNERICQLATTLLSGYQEKRLSLEEMLERKRKEESQKGKVSYVKHDEATATVLEFDDL
jgi:serine/threonine protein phosphatase PrpC